MFREAHAVVLVDAGGTHSGFALSRGLWVADSSLLLDDWGKLGSALILSPFLLPHLGFDLDDFRKPLSVDLVKLLDGLLPGFLVGGAVKP